MNEDQAWLNELQKQVDDAHHTTDRAESPPAGLWSSIRAQAQPIADPPKERQPMIITATMPQTLSSPVRSRPVSQEGGFRHYAKLFATVALVLAVAVGGWLAMSQMPGGDGNGRFAAIQATPGDESQVCGVEPLSINRVMEIVKNPIPFMANGSRGEPTEPEIPDNPLFNESQNAGWWNISIIGTGPTNAPPAEDFEQSSDFANAYINCVVHGTVGQVWTFYSPAFIQLLVLDRFPVFASEDEVRAYVTERISAPADEELSGEKYFRDATVSIGAANVMVNPDPQLALQQRMWGPYESVITFGIQVQDADGKVTYLTSGTGSELIRHPSGSQKTLSISVGIDAYSGNMVVFPYTPLSFSN